MIAPFAEPRNRKHRTVRMSLRSKRRPADGDGAAEGFDGLEDWMVASGALVNATP